MTKKHPRFMDTTKPQFSSENIVEDVYDWMNIHKCAQAYQIFGAIFLSEPEDNFVLTDDEQIQILDYFADDTAFDEDFLAKVLDWSTSRE